MFWDWIMEWGGLAFAVLNLLFVWGLWSLGRRFASQEDLVLLERRITYVEKNLELLRASITYQPGREEIENLQTTTKAIEVKLARVDATVRKLDETTRRLSDYLLNRGGA